MKVLVSELERRLENEATKTSEQRVLECLHGRHGKDSKEVAADCQMGISSANKILNDLEKKGKVASMRVGKHKIFWRPTSSKVKRLHKKMLNKEFLGEHKEIISPVKVDSSTEQSN